MCLWIRRIWEVWPWMDRWPLLSNWVWNADDLAWDIFLYHLLNMTLLNSYYLFRKHNPEHLISSVNSSLTEEECRKNHKSEQSSTFKVIHALMLSPLFACLKDVSPTAPQKQSLSGPCSLLLTQTMMARRSRGSVIFLCSMSCFILYFMCFEVYQIQKIINCWSPYTFVLH